MSVERMIIIFSVSKGTHRAFMHAHYYGYYNFCYDRIYSLQYIFILLLSECKRSLREHWESTTHIHIAEMIARIYTLRAIYYNFSASYTHYIHRKHSFLSFASRMRVANLINKENIYEERRKKLRSIVAPLMLCRPKGSLPVKSETINAHTSPCVRFSS